MNIFSLLDKLKVDHLSARKQRNLVVANLLGTVIAECETKAKAGKIAKALTDGDVIAIIRAIQKKIHENIALLETSARVDDLKKYSVEAEHLKGYLPQQLSTERLTEIAAQQHALGFGIGQIMAFFKEHFDGQFDSREAILIAKKIVSL